MRSITSVPLVLGLLTACSNDHEATSAFADPSNSPPAGVDDEVEGSAFASGGPSPTTGGAEPTGDAESTDATSTSASSQTTGSETGASTSGSEGAVPSSTDSTIDTSESGVVCNDYMKIVESIHPAVVLVIDKSGSMTADPSGYWDHDQNLDTPEVTRWRSLHDVVADFVEAHDGGTDLGVVFCPSIAAKADYSINACPVSVPIDVPVGEHNAADILASMPAADGSTIKGASPTTAAIVAATAELLAHPGDALRHIMLIADGPASCQADAPDATSLFEVYDADVEDAVADAHAQGIAVHVIGIEAAVVPNGSLKDGVPDNVATADTLLTLANLGGDGVFHNTFNQNQLAAALEAVLDDTHTCTVQLDEVPEYPLELSIAIDGLPVPHVDVCGDDPGWAWADAYTIAFCGSACDQFNDHGEADLSAFCR